MVTTVPMMALTPLGSRAVLTSTIPFFSGAGFPDTEHVNLALVVKTILNSALAKAVAEVSFLSSRMSEM